MSQVFTPSHDDDHDKPKRRRFALFSLGHFNKYLHHLLEPLWDKHVGHYVDDLYIFSDTLLEHLETLREVLEILI